MNTYPKSRYYFNSAFLKMKLRSACNQFSDLFSEFSKFIAPTYYHDRCERLFRLKIISEYLRFAMFSENECLSIYICQSR